VLQHHEREALMDILFARKHVNRERDLALVGLLLDSGLRGSEATSLRMRDGRSLLASGSLRVIGKGNKERLIRPMPTYRQFLEDYLEKRLMDVDDSCLFPSRRGKPIGGALLHHLVRKSLGAAGIAKSQMGPHLLRHTAASRMLAAGENLRQVQEYLGHSSLLTTSKYVHLLV
jgi:site-specific recombinase XerD